MPTWNPEEGLGTTSNTHPTRVQCTRYTLDFPEVVEQLEILHHRRRVEDRVNGCVNQLFQRGDYPSPDRGQVLFSNSPSHQLDLCSQRQTITFVQKDISQNRRMLIADVVLARDPSQANSMASQQTKVGPAFWAVGRGDKRVECVLLRLVNSDQRSFSPSFC